MSDETLLDNQEQSSTRGPAIVEKFVVRLPPGLLKQIRRLSESNHRSMNQQIISVLETYLQELQLQQMATGGNPEAAKPPADQALERKLQRLSPDKKAALLQLLG